MNQKKRFEAERKKNEEKDRARREEEENWKRADKRLNDLSKEERNQLWETTRAKILSSEDFKDATPQQLNILEMVMEGSIRSAIIEIFIQEERQNSEK